MLKKLAVLGAIILLSSPLTSVASQQGMVVSEHRLASEAGIEILRQGGNAIDAAIAVGYALAVVNPCCGNLGGGGFMLLHLANGKTIAINFREQAPLKATSNMYLDNAKKIAADATTKGYLAVAVPGTVLGLDTALKQYGTLPRSVVMAPAIRLAEKGYRITPYEAHQFDLFKNDFREQPNVAAIFLKNNIPYQAGDLFIQHDLANTLALISKDGSRVFYHGAIAKSIVEASNQHGGMLTMKDFSNYHIKVSAPIYCKYHGYTIMTTPYPSGGVTLCDMLNALQNKSLKQSGFHSAQRIEIIVKAMGNGFAKRNQRTPASKASASQHELTDTTHFSVVDKFGNAIAITYTINGLFGARVMAGNTGFFLNDEMDDFTTHPGMPNKFNLVQSSANAIQPGKQPLSSMTPTMVMKGNKVVMVLGSPGGPRIITAVLLALLNVIDYRMPLQAAIDAPRIHYQIIPDEISLEPGALSQAVSTQLTQHGYHLKEEHTWGAIEAIQLDLATGDITGANDIRRPDGAAIGLN